MPIISRWRAAAANRADPEPRGPQLPDEGLGMRTARRDAGVVRDAGSRRARPPVRRGVGTATRKLDDVERTPSARLLADMRQNGETFFELALRMSKLHKDYFLGLYPPNERRWRNSPRQLKNRMRRKPVSKRRIKWISTLILLITLPIEHAATQHHRCAPDN